jgi:tRNA pseudouridine32 synthase/23S rRNA pseudouridine746 synthase
LASSTGLRDHDAQAAIGLGLVLSALGNVLGLIAPPRYPPRELGLGGFVLGGASLVVAAWPSTEQWPLTRLGAHNVPERLGKIGLTTHELARNLGEGAVVGIVLGLPGAALLLLPEHLLPPVREDDRLGLMAGLRYSLGHVLLATAIGEELAFRGILQHKLRTVFGSRKSVLLSALFFALWHGVFNAHTLLAAGVRGRVRLATGSLMQLVAVYLGGLTFGALRERSGSLAGSILAHWLADLLLSVRVFGRPSRAKIT